MRSFVINMTVIAVTLRKNQATTGVSLHTIHCFSISSLEFVYLFTHLFIYLFIYLFCTDFWMADMIST